MDIWLVHSGVLIAFAYNVRFHYESWVKLRVKGVGEVKGPEFKS